MKRKNIYIVIIIALIIIISIVTVTLSLSKSKKTYDENNVGEIYFEPTSEEHIAISEDGLTLYAANEILVVAKAGVSKDEIMKLAAEFDAEIVGFIEQTGDYQWKLNNITDEASLKILIDTLNNNDLIEDAYPNYISEYSETVDEIIYGSEWSDDLSDSTDNEGLSWGVEVIKAPEVWEYFNSHSLEVSPVKIGLVDGGFDETHEDLKFADNGLFYNRKDPNGLEEKWVEKNISRDHGTHVAGIMAAIGTNSTGINGVYPYGNGNLYGVSTSGMGFYNENQNIWLSAMGQKIAYAELIVRNVKVINQSQGFNWHQFFKRKGNGDWESNTSSAEEIRRNYPSLDDLYTGFQSNDSYSTQKRNEAMKFADFLNRTIGLGYDFVIVSAAGNTGGREAEFNSYNCLIPNTPQYAEIYSRIIVVGSIGELNKNGSGEIIVDSNNEPSFADKYTISSFSDSGNRVDIFAPGQYIFSTVPTGDKYENKIYKKGKLDGFWSGTSMAAPHVAGVCANVWSLNNSLSGKDIKGIVTHSLLTRTIAGQEEAIIPYTAPSGPKGIIDCQKAIEEAIRSKTDKSKKDKTMGVIEGWVYEADPDGNSDMIRPVEGATIKVYNESGAQVLIDAGKDATGNKAEEVKTDNRGHYEFFTFSGTFSVTASKTGYESATINNITVEKEQVHYVEPIVLYNNNGSSNTNTGETEVQSNDSLSEDNNSTDLSQIYTEYVAETIIPQIGASNLEEYKATMYNDDYDPEWGNRNGLFAMDIRDINKDGKEELLLYVCKPYSGFNGYEYQDYNNGMSLEIYSIDNNGNVYKTDEECIGIYSGTGVSIFGGGYLSIDGKECLLVENMAYGVMANGLGYSLNLYQFDNNCHINLAHTISNTGGSTDFSFYCDSYKGNGNVEKEVFWADTLYLKDYGDEGIPFIETDSALLDGFKYIFSKLGIECPNVLEDLSYVTVPCFSKDENSMDRIFRIDTYGEHRDYPIGCADFTSSAHSWFSDGFDTSATFILPDSSCRYITRISIENFDAKKLELARNEIFARHGRKFKTDYIQDYFNSKAWYRGTIEPDDFDSNVFNDFEKENINFLLEAEKGISEKKSPSTSTGFTQEKAQKIIFNYLYDEVSDFAGDTFEVDSGYGSRTSMEYIAYFSVGEAAYQYAIVTVNLETGDGRVQYVYDYDAEIYDAFGVWPETMIPEYDINLYDLQ